MKVSYKFNNWQLGNITYIIRFFILARAIKDAARRAMDKIDRIKPFLIPTPFTLRVEYIAAKYAERITQSPEVSRLDDVTIAKKCHTLDDIVF